MFGGGKGGGRPMTETAPLLGSMRFQSAEYGQVLPILVGTNRLPGKLIEYTDFLATSHTDTKTVGGKGFGGVQQVSTWYTYSAAIILAACACGVEPTRGVGIIWDTKSKYDVPATNGGEMFTVPGGCVVTVAHASSFFLDLGVSQHYEYSDEIDDYYDPKHARTRVGSDYRPLSRVEGVPGPGEYSVEDGAYTFNAAQIGAEVRINYRYAPTAVDGADGTPIGILGFSYFHGGIPQSAWSYMASRHPERALGYNLVAYLANEAIDLGTSGQLENYNFEIFGPGAFGGGVVDATVRSAIAIVLSDPFIGCGWDPARLASMDALDDYTIANGLFFSPVIDAQRPVAEWLGDILEAANCAVVPSEGKLKFIPYGEASIRGNGHLYTPNTTPLYDLGPDDFGEDESTISIERGDPEETKNKVTVEFLNRSLGYNTDVATDKDDALIFRYGELAEESRKYTFITESDVAQKVANHRRLRITVLDAVRYKFTLGEEYCLLEPMDIVTLTEPLLGFDRLPVRIREIEEDAENGTFDITAEPFPWGAGTPALYSRQAVEGGGPDRNADPGNANAPIAFEPPDRMNNGAYELWLGISGESENWGGANIWVSASGSSYKQPWPGCSATAKARMGELVADLPAVTGHDVTSTLDVDLAQSSGKLFSGTDDDRDQFHTLCWVEGADGEYELISYKTATLVSGNRYQLTDLQRGVYGTPVLEHAAGSRFLRIDDAVIVVPFEAEEVGQTAHIKLTSFNTSGNREQSLADVDDYTYVLGGLFHNFGQLVQNNMTVDSVGTPGGGPFTAATVQVHGPAGTSDPGTFTKSDRTTRTHDAASFPDMALSTTYYAMLNPVSWQIYLLTTYADMSAAVFNGHLCIGSCRTPDAGGTGGFGGGGGGGFGGGCPTLDMQVPEGLTLGEMARTDALGGYPFAGYKFHCLTPETEHKFTASLRSIRRKRSLCVSLVADDGAVWSGSTDTPFTQPNGSSIHAGDMLGAKMYTAERCGADARWVTIVAVTPLGVQDVAQVDLGGLTFAVGVPGHRYAYSHNMSKPAPDET